MEINMDDYDIEAIRSDLEDYYGTAMTNVSPFAMVDLIDLSTKSDYEIIVISQLKNELILSGSFKKINIYKI